MNLAGNEFSEYELIRRAMCALPGKDRHGDPRWVLVMDLFCVGSTVAHALCQEFDLDPDEVIKK